MPASRIRHHSRLTWLTPRPTAAIACPGVVHAVTLTLMPFCAQRLMSDVRSSPEPVSSGILTRTLSPCAASVLAWSKASAGSSGSTCRCSSVGSSASNWPARSHRLSAPAVRTSVELAVVPTTRPVANQYAHSSTSALST